MDFLKDIAKSLISGFLAVLIPIGMVIGGAALIGVAVDNEWTILAWIGGGLLIAGLVWGAILYLFIGS